MAMVADSCDQGDSGSLSSAAVGGVMSVVSWRSPLNFVIVTLDIVVFGHVTMKFVPIFHIWPFYNIFNCL